MTKTRAANEKADMTQTCMTRTESHLKQSAILSDFVKWTYEAAQCVYFKAGHYLIHHKRKGVRGATRIHIPPQSYMTFFAAHHVPFYYA